MKEKDLIRFMDRMIEERKAEYALGTAHIYQASRNTNGTCSGSASI